MTYSSSKVQVSAGFRKMAGKAIMSIILFLIVYLILIAAAIGITLAFGYAALFVLSIGFGFITLFVAAGLASVGILILIFLIKFIFKKHKQDRSHLVEITREQEPELFAFIEDIAMQTGAQFPKHVYLSADVNASVFYDSSFWSMFLPVKKNLLIGIGLVNSASKDEFKGVLAHEFGHFSQSSMKVGSYVYQVNQVIYNMLYENDSYSDIVGTWANIHVLITIFVHLAVKIVSIIQSILQKMYEVVNISYMGLSREMEFHADEVAANVSGSYPLINFFLRTQLADYSYQSVLNYYQNRIGESKKPINIFPQQNFVMNRLAHLDELPIENNLPQVNLEQLNRYNKSKLNISNQWASHPSTEDRVAALKKLNIQKESDPGLMASGLFKNYEQTQVLLTESLFSAITFEKEIQIIDYREFEENYLKESTEVSYDKMFRHYYDSRNPAASETGKLEPLVSGNPSQLFSDAVLDEVFTFNSLEQDISFLKQLGEGMYNIKTFDYDGIKYEKDDAAILLVKLEKEFATLQENLSKQDARLDNHFYGLAIMKGQAESFKIQYEAYKQIQTLFERNWEKHLKFSNSTGFISQTLEFQIIEGYMNELLSQEILYKEMLRVTFEMNEFKAQLKPEASEVLEKYLANTYTYFTRPEYNNDALKIMFESMNHFANALIALRIKSKRNLLDLYVSVSH